MVVVAFFWGAGFTSSKAAVSDVPPLVTATMRYALASLVLIPVLLREQRGGSLSSLPRRAPWGALLTLALTAVVAYNVLYFVGLTYAPSSDSILLIPTTNPIWTIIFASLIVAERPGSRTLIGIGIALIGMALVLVGGFNGSLSGERFFGNVLFIVASIVFGLSHVMSRLTTRRISPIEATTLSGIIGGFTMAILALAINGFDSLLDAPPLYWFNIGLVAFGTTALGYVLFYRSIQRIGPGPTSFYTNLVPLVGLALSAIFLGEIPTPLQVMGGIIMLAAVIWATRAPAPVPAQLSTSPEP